MNILVVGSGLLGRKVAETLDKMGWDVAVMDNRESELEMINSDFGGVTFRGFPMDLRSLREAGVESCDAVAVTTSDDNLNITVAQIARDYFGIQNVITRISDPYRESVFESHGLHTVCPTNLAGEAMVSALVGEKQKTFIDFGLHTVSFTVRPAEKSQIGKSIWDLHGYAGEQIFGLIRANGAFELKSLLETAPEPGDSLVYAKKVD